jgi:hypothetical protein
MLREPINLFNVRRLNAKLESRDEPESVINPHPAHNPATYGVSEHTAFWSRDLFWQRYMVNAGISRDSIDQIYS